MGFVSLLVVALMPVVEVLLVVLLGAYLASGRCNLLTAAARADINRVVYAVFTPALMLASLARTVTLQDAISWWFMPVNIGIIFLTGGVLGWVVVLLLRPPQHLRGLVVASCSAANFGNLLLIVIPAVCREDGNPFGSGDVCTDRGLSYASFSMALGGLYIWTHTNSVMKRSSELYRKTMITHDVHDPKDYLVRSDEEPCRKQDAEEDDGDEEEGDVVSLPSESSSGVHEKLLAPLPTTGDHQRSGCSNNTSGNSMWDKLKHGAHQIVEELTAPPTVGAVSSLSRDAERLYMLSLCHEF